MYKAKIDIGGYKKGDEVPAEKAKLWSEMYLESPVEEIGKSKVVEKLKVVPKQIKKKSSILNDYLGRNNSVVKKNILEDDLTKSQLEELLEIEKSDKNRDVVIRAINMRLN